MVPLTQDKMESYAAKVLFAAPVQHEDKIVEEVIATAKGDGREVPFTCPFCSESYQVSADLAGKKITCRNCREACKVDDPNKKPPRTKKSRPANYQTWVYVALTLVTLIVGILIGRLFNS